MKLAWVIFKRELQAYFISPIAYIYITTALIFIAWYFLKYFFFTAQATMRVFFDFIPWLFLFLVPAITMRSWSEEKKAGTLDFLLTFPIHDIELILGKFFSCAALLLLTIMGTMPLALIVFLFGDPDMGSIITGYLGVTFLGLSFLSLGLFISSITKNQIIAFILSVVACFFTFILSHTLIISAIPNWLAPVFQSMGLLAHYQSIARGVIDLRDIFYYLSFITFFIFLNLQVLDGRKIETQ